VVTRQGQIVAHGTVVPLSCLLAERPIKVVHLIDWAADAKAVGSGVTLLNRIGQLADAVLSVGGSDATLKILPALGFQTRGQVTRFALPVRPFRRIEAHANWKLPAKIGRALLWSLQVPSRSTEGWTARQVTLEQVSSSAIPWPNACPGVTQFTRSAELIGYYLRCPATRIECFEVTHHGVVRGYFLLAFALTQARIADFWIESESRKDWCVLVELAVRQAKQNRNVAEVVSLGSDPQICSVLSDCGFRARGNLPVHLLPRKGVNLPESPIRIHMIDGDMAYWRGNDNGFWA
jgi:hypothetical protein